MFISNIENFSSTRHIKSVASQSGDYLNPEFEQTFGHVVERLLLLEHAERFRI
jgi:hypothetical protein